MIGGAASSCADVATYSIINSFEAEEREKYIGWVEAAMGAGMLTSPIIGGGILALGDFAYPFWSYALILLIMYPICTFILKGASREAHIQLLKFREE